MTCEIKALKSDLFLYQNSSRFHILPCTLERITLFIIFVVLLSKMCPSKYFLPPFIHVHTKFINFKYSTNTNENTFLWNNCTKYSTIFSIQMIVLFKIRINKLHEKSHSSIDHWYCLCCELNPYAKLDSVVKLW